jgi:Tol biopolymer transport system component
LAAGAAVLLWVGCSDNATGPEQHVAPDSPEVILSDAAGPGLAPGLGSIAGSGMGSVAYLSLPPGTIADAEYVIIRNLTDGDEDGPAVPVLDGGFDPLVISADEGDRLELEFHDGAIILGRKYGTVPRSRPPAIVRVAPPQGRTDVALSVRPTIIFSEPVDPATIDGAVRLLHDGIAVEGHAGVLGFEPWTVEFVPDALLEPQTEYQLEIGVTVRDLDGEALQAVEGSDFTTGTLASPPAPPPPPPTQSSPIGRIAFVRSGEGGPWIYLANADGTGVAPLVSGESPAWSRDGQKIAFTLGAEVRVINADGTGERLVTSPGRDPTWSPDGSELAYSVHERWVGPGDIDTASVHKIRLDGSGHTVLLTPSALGPEYVVLFQPAWSPDGQSIAFTAEWYADDGVGEIWVMDAHGSNPRMLEGTGPGDAWDRPYTSNGMFPSWSPDGSRIAFHTKRWLGGPFGFYVASRRADGSGGLSIHANSYPIFDLDWSPDGRHIAYDRGWPIQVGFVNLEAGGFAPPPIPGASQIAWSRVAP